MITYQGKVYSFLPKGFFFCSVAALRLIFRARKIRNPTMTTTAPAPTDMPIIAPLERLEETTGTAAASHQ
jgi:hypothetical protein